MKDDLTIADWARLAAYIDGEGTILLNKFTRTPNTKNQYNRIWLRILIGNTDPRLVNWFSDRFGGRVVTQKTGNEKHKTCYKWHVSCNHAKELLEGCLPYLIIKREQAAVALEFQATMGARGKAVPPNILARREVLSQAIHDLKMVRLPLETPIDFEIDWSTLSES